MSEFNELLNKKAVALSYDDDGQAAPVIVASGMGYLAEKIVETAQKNGVPVYEDNSLATMLTQLELGSEIPAELYQAIVDIYIYFLNYKPQTPQQPAQTEEEGEGESSETKEPEQEAQESKEETL